uniref:HMG box domain-containing protein n=1 Tax=Ganoderma boninense TaxID=34458 RepID=A0A5K1JUM8_9APHY|nr:HMG box domain-containing protein [Ganoderma boninense]
MDNPRTITEKALESFGTREAMIEFLMSTRDIDNVKVRLINRFLCFRNICGSLLPASLSRRQSEVSKKMGAVWRAGARDLGFWSDLYQDFVDGHHARFPYYWQKKAELDAMPQAKRLAVLATLPDPKNKRRKKKRPAVEEKRGDVKEKRPRRARAAPYNVRGTPSSSGSRSSRSSASRSRSSRSSSSSSLPIAPQGPTSTVPLFPTPPAVPVHHSARPPVPVAPPPPVPIHPYNQPSLPMFPSTQPSHMMPPFSYAGSHASPAAHNYGNALLGGDQYVVPSQAWNPAPVAAPQPPSLASGMQTQLHTPWTSAPALPAAAYHQPMTMTTTHSASWTTSATVPGPTLPQAHYHQPVNSLAAANAPLVPYHEADFKGYQTYQLRTTGDSLPTNQGAAHFPSYRAPFPASHLWTSSDAQAPRIGRSFAPVPQIGIRARL